MNDSENKKASEALDDEALHTVAGGAAYEQRGYCLDCKVFYPLSQTIQDGGKYYCPCHLKNKLLLLL